jgi:hypothetical protein
MNRRHAVGIVGVVVVCLAFAQDASRGLAEDLAGYLGWTRANAQKSFEPSAHPVAKDIYYNDAAAESVQAGTFPHAEGSTFVKETLEPTTLHVAVITAMRKVAGFNPEGGDWQYGMFERQDDGSFAGGWMDVEGAAMCMGCHVSAADQDYTFLSYLD